MAKRKEAKAADVAMPKVEEIEEVKEEDDIFNWNKSVDDVQI